MSKVKIEGNASGTGTFTIAAPNSNSDRSITLPDEAGTVLTSASDLPAANLTGTLPAIDGSNLTGISSGLTEADQWRMQANFTGQATPVTNWARVATDNFAKIGTGMTESSGIFTFPSTGYWLVYFQAGFYINGDDREVGAYIQTTSNNSSYGDATSPWSFIQQTGGNVTSTTADSWHIIYVQDTSLYKVRFRVTTVNTSTTVRGSAAANMTAAIFLKLGD